MFSNATILQLTKGIFRLQQNILLKKAEGTLKFQSFTNDNQLALKNSC